MKQFVAFALFGILITVSPAFSEELRMLVWDGYAPENHIEAFRQSVKSRYGTDLKITVKYASEFMDYRNALVNSEVDIFTTSHNYPKDPRHDYIKGKLVIPVDVKNLTHFKDILPDLQKTSYLTERGQVYGVPFIYGPYGLAYNTNVIEEAPTTWNILWDPKYAGKYTIASTINVTNIYLTALATGLDKSKIYQYDAVSSPEILAKLKYLVKNAKSLYGAVETADDLQGLSLAACWGFAFSELRKRGEIWKMATPEEGSTAYIDCWMLSHTLRNKPKLKQIAEAWIDYTISPDFQVEQVVRTLNNFPVNFSITDRITPEETSIFHVDDPNYFQNNFIPWEILDRNTRKGFELIWKKATR